MARRTGRGGPFPATFVVTIMISLTTHIQARASGVANSSSTASVMSTAQCTMQQNVDFEGGDIGKIENVPSAASCCGECNRHAKCQRWTYSTTTQRCFLKLSVGWTKQAHPGKISGAVIRPSPSPSPRPLPAAIRPPAPRASPKPSPSPPTPIPADGKFTKADYGEVLGMSWQFYNAQRSGPTPSWNRIPWRRHDSHLTDPVVGGWYDAGDFLKLPFPLASTVTLLSWGMIEYADVYEQTGQVQYAQENLYVAVDYLLRSHIAPRKYIGQIGNPTVDHNYWGRAEQENTVRPAYVYDDTMNASDLMGKVSAALASASLVFREVNATYAAELLTHAKDLWSWGDQMGKGKYSDYYQSATKSIYPSTDSQDDMAWGATWIFKATGDTTYLDAAVRYWMEKDWDVTCDWDNEGAVTAVVLANLIEDGVEVPQAATIQAFVKDSFIKAWVQSNGYLEIVKTPKGMSFPNWSNWGNLQLSTTAAFLALTYAKHTASATLQASVVPWARSQVDYALGSSGHSFVVGFGNNPPTHCQHAGASCPDYPARCDWANYAVPTPNPQVTYGALVGGPSGPGDDTYHDVRSDYVTNEVACDYNAGLAGALAALYALL